MGGSEVGERGGGPDSALFGKCAEARLTRPGIKNLNK